MSCVLVWRVLLFLISSVLAALHGISVMHSHRADRDAIRSSDAIFASDFDRNAAPLARGRVTAELCVE
ncbi:hypothetical protein Pcac1_g9345 [Phytophthora cactorum]|nr:hypothetical protein Pcac1_g9345 [Phytophthora cactorum]